MEFLMEDDDTMIVTINITSMFNDISETKNVSISKTYPVDTTWTDIMDQCIQSLNSYGFIINDRTIYVDSDGHVSSL